jgi:predicted transcriptional regulator
MTVCKKDTIRKVISSLPANTSIEEAMERLYLLSKIEKGIQEADAGRTVSHDEAKRKLKKWLD